LIRIILVLSYYLEFLEEESEELAV